MQLQQYSDTWNRFLVDELFHESFVAAQSNILYALNQRYTSGLLDLGENV